MLLSEKRALGVFRRVRDFLAKDPPEVGYGSVTQVVEQLKVVTARLEQHMREQDARDRFRRSLTVSNRNLARRIRREFLRPLFDGSRSLFADSPALLAAFQMPKARDYEGLINAADAIAEAAIPHEQRFVEVGLPLDTPARLKGAVSALREGIGQTAVEVGQRASSTAGLRVQYARGRDLLRMLDAMLAGRLASAPHRLAEWKSLSRFLRKGVAELADEGLSPSDEPAVPVRPALPSTTESVAAAA